MLQSLEHGQRQKEDKAVADSPEEEGRPDGQFRLITPEAQVRNEAGGANDVAAVGFAEGRRQEAFLSARHDAEHDPAGDGEGGADGQAARLCADPECADETEDIEGVSTQRIRSAGDDLLLLSAADVE